MDSSEKTRNHLHFTRLDAKRFLFQAFECFSVSLNLTEFKAFSETRELPSENCTAR